MMRGKIIGVLFCAMIGAGILTGCASTPEDSLVKQKGEAGMKNYEEADTEADSGTGEKLQQILGAPERYQSKVSDETGKLQILTDAKVEIPDSDKVSAIAVSQHSFDQAEIDRMKEIFFPDAVLYSAESYYTQTKEDCMKKLETLKGYVAEGNLDPFDYGMDEDGNYYYDIYGQIESAERMYEDAPADKELEEVSPQLERIEQEQGIFSGVACLPDGTAFQYSITIWGSMPMLVQIDKIREAKNWGSEQTWSEYKGLKASAEDVPEVEEIEAEIGISMEEAQKLTDEKTAALGLEHMELTSWEYGLFWEGSSYTRAGLEDAGYILHYTRKLDNIPVTYTMDWGGALENIDSEAETWCYERLDYTVTEEGIESVDFCNQYDIGEIRTENLSLLSFDKIMDIYEKMMVIQNADIINYESARTCRIDRITFGYDRIYEPSTDSRSGLLVPVWDFFGSFETQTDDSVYTNAVEFQSYLTINAIDGSIIDRSLGY